MGSNNAPGAGNQQERPIELAWLGGLACGEGCFFLSLERKFWPATQRVQIQIVPGFHLFLDDEVAVERAEAIMRVHELGSYVATTRRGKGIRVIGAKRVVPLIKALLPYLYGQKLQAALLVREFCELRARQPRKTPYGEPEIELVEQIRALNSIKGKARNSVGILRD